MAREVPSTLRRRSLGGTENRRFQQDARQYDDAMAFASVITREFEASPGRGLAVCPARPNLSCLRRRKRQGGCYSQILSAVFCGHLTGDPRPKRQHPQSLCVGRAGEAGRTARINQPVLPNFRAYERRVATAADDPPRPQQTVSLHFVLDSRTTVYRSSSDGCHFPSDWLSR
jgi:hypothetical protein